VFGSSGSARRSLDQILKRRGYERRREVRTGRGGEEKDGGKVI
jgi:hypothetical protein